MMAHQGATVNFYQPVFENCSDSTQSSSIQTNRNFPSLTPSTQSLFDNSIVISSNHHNASQNFIASGSMIEANPTNSQIDVKAAFSLPGFNSSDFFQQSGNNQSQGSNLLIHQFFNSPASTHHNVNVSAAPIVLTNPAVTAVKSEFSNDSETTIGLPTSSLSFSIEQFQAGNLGSVLPSMAALPFSTTTLSNNSIASEISVDGKANQLSHLLRASDASESIGSEASNDTATSVLDSGTSDTSKLLTRQTLKESSSVSPSKASTQRNERKTVPSDSKDLRYYERRLRNNLAAKRSRDNRKKREDSIAIRASFLEKENSMLRTQLAELREETNRLRNLVCQRRLRT